MPSITPINQINMNAKNMVKSIVNESPDKTQAIKKFFQHANEAGLQGPAIVAYHTQWNILRNNTHKFSDETAKKIKSIPQIIETELNTNPEVKKEGEVFLNKIEELYPNSLENRVSLASQGAVTADKVEPKSRVKKWFVYINRLLKEDI